MAMERSSENALLPEDMEADTLIEQYDPLVEIGQGGWIEPLWVIADAERRLWLYTHLRLSPKPSPLEQMYVFRDEAGYVVDLSNCQDTKWETNGMPSDAYIETTRDQVEVVPVVRVIR